MSRTLIVGGVAAGASTATRLRRLKENEEIILFERGEYISYANCGLPYHVGDVIKNREDLLVTKKQIMNSRFNIEVRDNSEVVSIDRKNQKITVRPKDGKEYQERYDNLVIATGASPIRSKIEGIDSDKVKTLWTVPDTDKIKDFIRENAVKRAVVIGGGFIGLEMAENLRHIGLEVTIVEAANQVLSSIDYEMALLLNENIRANGVKLILGDGVVSFEDNGADVTTHLASGESITADLVILSIGIRPNSSLAVEAGLEINERGGIVVDENMRTSDSRIYAAGDVVEITDFIFGGKTMIPLAGPANKQGRIVANNIAGLDSTYKGTQGSSIVKVFDLTAASTGVNEKTLNKKGLIKDKDYKSIIIAQNSHAGYYPGAQSLIIKLIFSIDGETIYGAQIVGKDGVDKRIDTLGTAIRFGASVYDLTGMELAYAPPFSSAKDPVNMLGFVAENVLNGMVEFCNWNETDTDKDAIILDVREKQELEMFCIDRALHIPMGSLRERLKELDKSKKYIIMCAIGVRAYNTYRILKQNGFENVKVYPAGARLYMPTHINEGEVSNEFICKY